MGDILRLFTQTRQPEQLFLPPLENGAKLQEEEKGLWQHPHYIPFTFLLPRKCVRDIRELAFSEGIPQNWVVRTICKLGWQIYIGVFEVEICDGVDIRSLWDRHDLVQMKADLPSAFVEALKQESLNNKMVPELVIKLGWLLMESYISAVISE